MKPNAFVAMPIGLKPGPDGFLISILTRFTSISILLRTTNTGRKKTMSWLAACVSPRTVRRNSRSGAKLPWANWAMPAATGPRHCP